MQPTQHELGVAVLDLPRRSPEPRRSLTKPHTPNCEEMLREMAFVYRVSREIRQELIEKKTRARQRVGVN